MLLVGLTGGIACGKSTVSTLLRELGCPLIDADQVAREVVEPGKAAWKKIRQNFGAEVFNEDGTLNRDRLGQIIFRDAAKRRLLNSITHPEIYKVILWRVVKLFFSGSSFVILDLPLLYESGKMVKFMKTVVVVSCDRELQLKRLIDRNGYTTEEAEDRINAQMSLEEKRRRADYVIDNSGTVEELRSRVVDLHTELNHSRAHWTVRALVGGVMLGCLGLVAWLGWKLCL